MGTVDDVLRIARGEIGYWRYSDPEPGTKYGRWYARLTGSGYFAESGVPYCAMFVSWVMASAGVPCAGLPGSYCPSIEAAARRAGATVGARQARPGDLVLFDWGGDGVCDHVGIVESNPGSYLVTIEGNTSRGGAGSQGNGGWVARRTRRYGVVRTCVRPNYGAKPKAAVKATSKAAPKAAEEEDMGMVIVEPRESGKALGFQALVSGDGIVTLATSEQSAALAAIGVKTKVVTSAQWEAMKKVLPVSAAKK
jgi:hypothetical protein